ncbi:MAG: helical backbone metal receptor, partial [Bacteroidota bacterium]|nr:helical backbone metal receptor [Bacteroidota bacterium]
RIVSLVPSLTELLSDLYLDKETAGITKFCVHPHEWYQSKVRVGGTKNVNINKIHDVAPDLIIANKEENVKEQVEELSRFYNVLVTDVHDLESALICIKEIGELTGRSEQAIQLAANIKAKFQNLQSHFEKEEKHRAAYLIWQRPYMAAGGDTFINNMMQYCGIENIFGSLKRYPEISLNELKEKGCEFLLLSSEPFPFKLKHAEELKENLSGIQIVLADGEMFSWYGSRLLKAADYFESFHLQLMNMKEHSE